MSIRELFREFVLSKRREIAQHNQDMALAWTIAKLMRAKELPKLETLLVGTSSDIKKDRHASKVLLEGLSAHYGIPLQRTRLIRVEKHG